MPYRIHLETITQCTHEQILTRNWLSIDRPYNWDISTRQKHSPKYTCFPQSLHIQKHRAQAKINNRSKIFKLLAHCKRDWNGSVRIILQNTIAKYMKAKQMYVNMHMYKYKKKTRDELTKCGTPSGRSGGRRWHRDTASSWTGGPAASSSMAAGPTARRRRQRGAAPSTPAPPPPPPPSSGTTAGWRPPAGQDRRRRTQRPSQTLPPHRPRAWRVQCCRRRRRLPPWPTTHRRSSSSSCSTPLPLSSPLLLLCCYVISLSLCLVSTQWECVAAQRWRRRWWIGEVGIWRSQAGRAKERKGKRFLSMLSPHVMHLLFMGGFWKEGREHRTEDRKHQHTGLRLRGTPRLCFSQPHLKNTPNKKAINT